MTGKEPQNIVLEHLRAIRKELGDLKRMGASHGTQLIDLRKQVHTVEGSGLRVEEGLARLEGRVELIEKRLGLIDV
jgi:hypothetical protein